MNTNKYTHASVLLIGLLQAQICQQKQQPLFKNWYNGQAHILFPDWPCQTTKSN